MALRTLSRYVHSKPKRVALTKELVETLEVIKKVSKSIPQTWVIFTDGAYEPTSDIPASIGGVLVALQEK